MNLVFSTGFGWEFLNQAGSQEAGSQNQSQEFWMLTRGGRKRTVPTSARRESQQTPLTDGEGIIARLFKSGAISAPFHQLNATGANLWTSRQVTNTDSQSKANLRWSGSSNSFHRNMPELPPNQRRWSRVALISFNPSNQ